MVKVDDRITISKREGKQLSYIDRKKPGIKKRPVGRPRISDEPRISRPVSFDQNVLKALQALDMSVSEAVNVACKEKYGDERGKA